jgi:hypothetical protein
MKKFNRFTDLCEAGYVNNRMTLHRWIEQGIFPPPVDLSSNSIAWTSDDLAERDARVKAGITEPNPEWLKRNAERKLRLASRPTGKAA